MYLVSMNTFDVEGVSAKHPVVPLLPLFIPSHLLHQASLCQVDVDEGIVECPDDLPSLPDMDRLTLRVSEEVQEHAVDCADVTVLPHSPETTPSRPSIIEALKYVHMCVCGCWV